MANGQAKIAKQPESLNDQFYQVWMGDLTPEMGSEFITTTFEGLGVKLSGVKRVYRGDYAFLKVEDPELLPWVLNLHGTPIPTLPTRLFKLNRAKFKPIVARNMESSVFVCDISRSVTDKELYDFFKPKFPSVIEAFVCRDQWGYQKTYGFVTFSNEEERKRSIREMDRAVGLGYRPITVRMPRHEQFRFRTQDLTSPTNTVPSSEATPTTATDQSQQELQNDESDSDDEEVDPNPPLNIEELNLEIFHEEEEHFLTLERCRWQPILSLTSKINSKRVKVALDRTHPVT